MNGLKAGFAMTGSYCTFDKALEAMEKMAEIYDGVRPIMSERAFSTDTRFGTAQSFIDRAEKICGATVISTIKDAEPIGPLAPFDILIIAPCTGSTAAKLASGMTDTSVAMAVKAHLRNERPVLLAIATNDGLSGSAANIGRLLNKKNIFFVPYCQDDPVKKPHSLVARFELIPEAAEAALRGKQLQPILYRG